MNTDNNNRTGCLFPFGESFLPIFMFFFHLNQPPPETISLDEEDEEDDEV